MINVLINGFNGKMGQEVFKSITNSSEFNVCCGVDRINKTDLTIPIYPNYMKIKEKVDVIIDFSVPESTFNALKYAKDNNIPIVIATTGFSPNELNLIKKFSNHIPVFQSSNMSFEVNLLANIVSNLATKLKNSDIEIVDVHHKNKIDSPSGTALLLANKINSALDNKMSYSFDRHSVRKPRDSKEIGIHSVRGGTEVGKHTIMFLGEDESFEITHTVTSRSVFAKGSLKAAKFLINQSNGFYNMDNLL